MLTPWGLIRHYWVLLKLVLTSIATFLLIEHITPADILSNAAAPGTLSAHDRVRTQILAYACGGLVVVATSMTLGVFKPRGLTRPGHRPRPTAVHGDPSAADLGTSGFVPGERA
jgi:hypothetical protein